MSSTYVDGFKKAFVKLTPFLFSNSFYSLCHKLTESNVKDSKLRLLNLFLFQKVIYISEDQYCIASHFSVVMNNLFSTYNRKTDATETD